MYVCLGDLKQGFKAIGRDLLGLDGAFIKGPYQGQVLSAVGNDPNNGIYPLCYAIVEAEATDSWTWFLNCIADDLDLHSNSNFTFMSDRQKDIILALAKVFPCAEHRFCLRHILENMKLHYRGKAYKDLLWKLATSTTDTYFQNAMNELQKLNNKAQLWLSKIPPKHWSRAHFSGRAHSDVLLNNMCEVFNAKIVEGRDKPIILMLEYIREYLMRKIVTVLKVIDRSEGLLTPTATKLFESIKKEAIRRWEITRMSCKHAVASMWNMASNGQHIGLPETWVHKVYHWDTWKNVYSFKIFPINGKIFWSKSMVPTTLTAPEHHKPIERPKKTRKKSVTELEEGILSKKATTITCAKRKKKGHNSRTCKGQGQV